jgi:hypothetical protein
LLGPSSWSYYGFGVEDSRNSVLVNNLDLKVFKDDVIYYPWKLDVNPQSQLP